MAAFATTINKKPKKKPAAGFTAPTFDEAELPTVTEPDYENPWAGLGTGGPRTIGGGTGPFSPTGTTEPTASTTATGTPSPDDSGTPSQPPAKPPRPEITAEAGTPEAEQQGRDLVTWYEDQLDDALDELERKSKRKYRGKYDPETRRVTIQYSEDGGKTWVDDPQAENAFERAYQAYDKATALVEGAPKTFAEWYDRQNGRFGLYQDIGELVEIGENLMERYTEGSMSEQAMEDGARMLGFDNFAEMRGALRDARRELNEARDQARGSLGDPGGLSNEQIEQRNAAYEARIAHQNDLMVRAMDNIYGATGSTQRAFQVGEEFRREMRNDAQKHAQGLAAEDAYRRQTNFENELQRYNLLVGTGQASINQAANMVAQDRANFLQAYSATVSTALAQNQQLQSLSAHDAALVESQAQMFLAIGDREVGLDIAIQQRQDQLYEAHVRPAAIMAGYRLEQLKIATNQWATLVGAHMETKRIEAEKEIARKRAAAAAAGGIFGFIGKLLLFGLGIAATAATGGAAAPLVGGSAGLLFTPEPNAM